jgi:hypothetical protein
MAAHAPAGYGYTCIHTHAYIHVICVVYILFKYLHNICVVYILIECLMAARAPVGNLCTSFYLI